MDQATQQLELVQQIYAILADFLINYSFQVIGAVLILIAGFIVSRMVGRFVVRVGERRDIDVTLRLFMGNIARLLVLAFFIVIALGNFGITVTPLVAAIGALAFGVLAWAELLRRVFAIDVLECPRCGARTRLLAAIQPPEATSAILECLGLPARAPPVEAARPEEDAWDPILANEGA